ncbi:hypothetical protein Pmi06nite_17550 [Planotetraspora mira]|uniref:Uncharacterized protein n=1 Tax=Planotetraspora mira TaxID=58121 RepID=A0A8J3TJQ6_9ACTN|nr:hypothetical protein Pmi06nite_17550 [Planotetraspora mira]
MVWVPGWRPRWHTSCQAGPRGKEEDTSIPSLAATGPLSRWAVMSCTARRALSIKETGAVSGVPLSKGGSGA